MNLEQQLEQVRTAFFDACMMYDTSKEIRPYLEAYTTLADLYNKEMGY